MKNLLKATAALSAAAMLLSLSAVFPAKAASVCNVDTSVTHQKIRGFGGINLPDWITQGDMTDAQRQKAFGNGPDELGLTVLRIYCSDDSNAWKNAVPTAKYAQKMGATIFATPWNPPASMRFNGNGTITGGKYQLDKSKSADYAKHLNSYVKYMESQGINLYSISVQNEPDYAAEWTYWSPQELTSFIANYGKAVTEGTNAKLMSPESFQYRKDIYNSILANPQAAANVDLYGTHFYGTPRDWMDFPALENSGKEIWMTEVYVPNSDADSADRWPEALDVSENIHNGVVVGNLNAYVWWYIRRSYGLLKENGQISKRGYCMAQYSKFVRPGDIRIDATESPEKNVYVSAYKNSNNQVTIVAVNKSDNGYSQQFSLSKGENITDVDRYRTSGSENLALTENLEYTGSSFWAQLPAKSVSTFIISTDGTAEVQPTESEPATEVQPDEKGYYIHETFENGIGDFKGHGGTDVSLSGRMPYEGQEAMIVQNREKTWQGAEIALDSNTFKAGSTYSFSANACYLDGDNATDTFALTIQYTGADGETHYASVARAELPKGQWGQLANQNFTIPEGASNVVLYVETTEAPNNIYLDDVIVAKAGTAIAGAVPVIETETEATEPETVPTESETVQTETETSQQTETTPTETETSQQTETTPTETETSQQTETTSTETETSQQTETTPTETETSQQTETTPTETVPTETEPQSSQAESETTPIPNVKYGDVNLDDKVNILDVITLNRVILGKDSLTDAQSANADANKNGFVESSDSLSIMKFIVGLLSALPDV